jgi:glycosyltransferase involved in cell wall biosynthesis
MMAERAIQLIKDPKLAHEMTVKGHEECRKYSWESVRGSWIEKYRTLALAN